MGVRKSRGDIVLFTDASCVPDDGWLDAMLAPILTEGELMVAGSHRSSTGPSIRDDTSYFLRARRYVREAPTINLAFRTTVHAQLGGFDESFAYGSDVDFTWRANDSGFRIRYVPDAIVRHDWGGPRDEVRRAYKYGQARARLYLKHPRRWRELFTSDVIAVVYPAYLLSLPLARVRQLRWLPLVIVLPALRNRQRQPLLTLADHLVYAVGVLRELARHLPAARPG